MDRFWVIGDSKKESAFLKKSPFLFFYKPIPCSKNRSPMQSLCLQKLNWLKSNWLNFPRNANDTYPPKKSPLLLELRFNVHP